MLDAIVLDIESLNDPEKTSWATGKLGVGVAVIYESRTDRFSAYDGRSPAQLAECRARVMRADIVAGFNIWAFDLPLLFGLDRSAWEQREKGELVGRCEIADRMWHDTLVVDARRLLLLGLDKNPNGGATGQGTNLDDVARETLAAAAPTRKGEIESSKLPGLLPTNPVGVAFACLHHVCLERDLLRFGLRYGYLLTGEGRKAAIGYDAELWANNMAAAYRLRESQLI